MVNSQHLHGFACIAMSRQDPTTKAPWEPVYGAGSVAVRVVSFNPEPTAFFAFVGSLAEQFSLVVIVDNSEEAAIKRSLAENLPENAGLGCGAESGSPVQNRPGCDNLLLDFLEGEEQAGDQCWG